MFIYMYSKPPAPLEPHGVQMCVDKCAKNSTYDLAESLLHRAAAILCISNFENVVFSTGRVWGQLCDQFITLGSQRLLSLSTTFFLLLLTSIVQSPNSSQAQIFYNFHFKTFVWLSQQFASLYILTPNRRRNLAMVEQMTRAPCLPY